jgi:hypothetical protein
MPLLFLMAALASSMVAWESPAMGAPNPSGEAPRFELRAGENYFRADGLPGFVLGRNPAATTPPAYDEHFRHAAEAGERFLRIHHRESSHTWRQIGSRRFWEAGKSGRLWA